MSNLYKDKIYGTKRASANLGLAHSAVYTCVTTAIIMILLQPFGLDQVEHNKYPIMAGYSLLAGLAYLLTDLITSHVLRIPRRDNDTRRNILVSLLMCPIMGAFVSCYASLVFTGSIKGGWYGMDGNFTLHSFWINSGYTLIVSFFITLFDYYRSSSRQLAIRLKEEMELNAILAERKENDDVTSLEKRPPCPTASKLCLQGSSKESVTLRAADLLFIESEGNYANVHYLQDGRPAKKLLRCTLKQLEEMLESEKQIIRCHRAFIVNLMQVKHVEGNTQGYQLTLNHAEQRIPVSRAYAATVYQEIEGKGMKE